MSHGFTKFWGQDGLLINELKCGILSAEAVSDKIEELTIEKKYLPQYPYDEHDTFNKSENIHMEAGNKKQLIADTYLKLFEKKPSDKITVKMLIDECGLSRQTFYYHFKDIIDVVEYALHGILDSVCEKCIQT